MAKGLTLDIGANTREVVRGAKDTAEALEDVSDSLDDLAKDADKAGDKLGDSIEDGAKDAEKSVDRLERSFRELATAGRKSGGDAGEGIKRGVKGGADDGKKAIGEMGDEALQEAREMGASFGSVEDALDSVQSVISNMFSGFGPAGIVAGVAAAAGIGVLMAQATTAAEAINTAKEKTGELALAIVDAGGDIKKVDIGSMMRDWGVEIVDNKEAWEFWQEGAVSNLDRARKVAKETGVDFKTMFRAMSGQDPKAAIEALDGIDRQIERNADRLAKMRAEDPLSSIFGAGAIADIDNSNQALRENKKQIELLSGSREDAVKDAKALEDATRSETAALEASTAAEDAKAARIATIDSAYDDAAAATDDYINAESGLFDTGAYITAMQAKEQALKDYQETLATSPLTPAAKAFLDSQGAESAATFLAGYKAATPAQQAELRRIWDEAGKTSSGAYTTSLKNGIPATLPGPTVKVTVDKEDARRQFNDLVRNPLSVNVVPRLIARPGLSVP